MSFQEKSTIAILATLVAVFGWYFALVLGELATSPARELAFRGLMVPVVAVVVILLTVAHLVLAVSSPSEAGKLDERDRLIARRGESLASTVLAVGVMAGLGLALVDAQSFWIAQALLATLVLAEITEGVAKLVLYRRGVAA